MSNQTTYLDNRVLVGPQIMVDILDSPGKQHAPKGMMYRAFPFESKNNLDKLELQPVSSLPLHRLLSGERAYKSIDYILLPEQIIDFNDSMRLRPDLRSLPSGYNFLAGIFPWRIQHTRENGEEYLANRAERLLTLLNMREISFNLLEPFKGQLMGQLIRNENNHDLSALCYEIFHWNSASWLKFDMGNFYNVSIGEKLSVTELLRCLRVHPQYTHNQIDPEQQHAEE
jgi:hypothetical protein